MLHLEQIPYDHLAAQCFFLEKQKSSLIFPVNSKFHTTSFFSVLLGINVCECAVTESGNELLRAILHYLQEMMYRITTGQVNYGVMSYEV